jgi:hypothetical protein
MFTASCEGGREGGREGRQGSISEHTDIPESRKREGGKEGGKEAWHIPCAGRS